MKQKIAVFFFLLFFVASPPISARADDALLARVDRARAPERPFTFTVSVRPPFGDSLTLTVAVKDRTKSLVRYIEPSRARGRTLLFVGRNMWFYAPGLRRALRVSPSQQISAGVNNADIARLVFAADYGVEEATSDTEKDDTLSRLVLSGRTKSAAYRRIELFIKTVTANPVRAVFFGAGERRLKTVHFEHYAPVLGRDRPTGLRIINHMAGDQTTILTYADFKLADAPDHWFQPSFLKRLR